MYGYYRKKFHVDHFWELRLVKLESFFLKLEFSSMESKYFKLEIIHLQKFQETWINEPTALWIILLTVLI